MSVTMDEVPIIIPRVIEKEGQVERYYDIFSRLLRDRIIFLGLPIVDFTASIIVAQILFLANEKKDQDINVYINSPGGAVDGMFAIHDTMRFVPCDVATYCVGYAASAAAILLSAGTKGKRYILPNARVLLHQPRGGAVGTAADIKIDAEEIVKLRAKGNKILSDYTGQPLDKIEHDTDRDFWMSAEEALDYGVVDEAIVAAKEA